MVKFPLRIGRALLCVLATAAALPLAAGTAQEIYDLVGEALPLTNGKLLFIRHRYPLLDPVLRTYETYMFAPGTRRITLLQKYEEKLYIPPIVSRDGSTVCWHSVIEGNDFLMTTHVEEGRASRLRFDTGGYFVSIALDYDNDTIAAAIKRGLNKQGLYVISNRMGSIRRLREGTQFSEIGFLENGNICYVDTVDGRKILGIIGEKKGAGKTIEEVDYVKKTPRGDGILYSKGPNLYLFRIYGFDSVQISRSFNAESRPPLVSNDGTTVAVLEKDSIKIVNIPSGDIFYLLSMDTEGVNALLSDFTFYVAKGKKVYALEHKKTDQPLVELFEHGEEIRILAVSPDDRYLVLQGSEKDSLLIYNSRESPLGGNTLQGGGLSQKRVGNEVEQVLYTAAGTAFYLTTRSHYPEHKPPVRELYRYDFAKETLYAISAASNTDVKLYLRKE
jgi:hypothetical protein